VCVLVKHFFAPVLHVSRDVSDGMTRGCSFICVFDISTGPDSRYSGQSL